MISQSRHDLELMKSADCTLNWTFQEYCFLTGGCVTLQTFELLPIRCSFCIAVPELKLLRQTQNEGIFNNGHAKFEKQSSPRLVLAQQHFLPKGNQVRWKHI